MRARWNVTLAHRIASRTRADRLRNLHPEDRCALVGATVDPTAGRVLVRAHDVELPGASALRLTRHYASSWSHRDSPLGFGWSHSLDQAVWTEPGRVVWRTVDGRELEFDVFDRPDRALRSGEVVAHPIERATLRRLNEARWRVETRSGEQYLFERVAGDHEARARLVSVEGRGPRVSLAYDHAARLAWAWDEVERCLGFEHDDAGRLRRVLVRPSSRDALAPAAAYERSLEGDLVVARDALGHAARYEYDGHLLVRRTDRVGASRCYGYDGRGSDASCVRAWGDGGALDRALSYLPERSTALVQDSRGLRVVVEFDPLRHVTRVSGRGAWERDEELRIVCERDERGREVRFAYDARDEVRRALGSDDAEVRIERDERGRPTLLVDADQGEWRWERAAAPDVEVCVDPAGRRTTVELDRGAPKAVTRPDRSRVEVTRDARGLVCALSAPDDALRVERDEWGRAAVIEDEWDTRRFTYDACGRVVAIAWRDGAAATIARDPEGRPLAYQGDAREVRWGYTAAGLLAVRREGAREVGVDYDAEGSVARLWDERGEVCRLERDELGRVIEERLCDGRAWRYRYRGALPDVTRVVAPSGAWFELAWDVWGRVTRIRHSDGRDERYRYAPSGALLEARCEGPEPARQGEPTSLGAWLSSWDFPTAEGDEIPRPVALARRVGPDAERALLAWLREPLRLTPDREVRERVERACGFALAPERIAPWAVGASRASRLVLKCF